MKSGKKFLFSVLTCTNPAKALKSNLNDLISVVPEIKDMIDFDQKHPQHDLGVWEHTLLALSHSLNNFDIRFALLFHDIGKPLCFQEVDGVTHYNGHAEKSAEIANRVLTKMDYPETYIKYICNLIELHDTPLTKDFIKQKPILSKYLFEIQKCNSQAHSPEHNEKRLKYIEKISKFFNKKEDSKEK